MSRLSLCVPLLLLASTPLLAQPVKRADLKPGLVFVAQDMAKSSAVRTIRLEPIVGLTLAPSEAIHPQASGGDAASCG